MARQSSKKRREKKEISDEKMGDLDKVIAGIEKLVDAKMDQRMLLRRVGTFEENDKELSAEEVKKLPEAAKWATDLRKALESGKPKNLDKVA
jgi:hypothetical protein